MTIVYTVTASTPCDTTFAKTFTSHPGFFEGPGTAITYTNGTCEGSCYAAPDPCDDCEDCETPGCEDCPGCPCADCEDCETPGCEHCPGCPCQECEDEPDPCLVQGCEECPEFDCEGDPEDPPDDPPCDDCDPGPCWEDWHRPWDYDHDEDGLPDYLEIRTTPIHPDLGPNPQIEHTEFKPEMDAITFDPPLPSIGTDHAIMEFPLPIPGQGPQTFRLGTRPTAIDDSPLTQAIMQIRTLIRILCMMVFSIVFVTKIWLTIRQY